MNANTKYKILNTRYSSLLYVAGAGFEPATSWLPACRQAGEPDELPTCLPLGRTALPRDIFLKQNTYQILLQFLTIVKLLWFISYFILSIKPYIGCNIAIAKKPTAIPIINIITGSTIEEMFFVS